MSYQSASAVQVLAWGRPVGVVAINPASRFYAFEYEPEWLRTGVELSPIVMRRGTGVFEFPDLAPETYFSLPAMLADALPDRFGNALVNAWMAQNGVQLGDITALDRLAYASDRAMGALSFRPPTGPSPTEISVIQIADLVTAARSHLEGTIDDAGATNALRELITVGSSAGGARAKAVVAYNPTTGQIRSGQFNAPDGFEHWLLKLDGVGDPSGQHDALVTSQQYCRVEYAYYLMAREAGIAMAESFLLAEGPRAHFMTKRFDRREHNERLHLQSLCALGHLDFRLARTHSYSSYFLTARSLGLGASDFAQMFRRVVFNVMGVNRDDHTKNFAFLLPENAAWELAPAFDVTHSHWEGDWSQAQQMSVNGRFTEISKDDLRQLGDLHEVPGIERALTEVEAAIDAWPDFARAAGVDASTTQKITEELREFRPH